MAAQEPREPREPFEKALPHNREAEAGVLGSLLIDPGAIEQVADFLRAEDFHGNAHREIYRAAFDLYERGNPADLITLTDELARRGQLEVVGGIAYVSSLANQVPTSANAAYYGHIVERTSILRQLISASGQIAAVAYSEPDAVLALDAAEQLIFALGQRVHGDGAGNGRNHASLREDLRTFLEDLEALERGETPTGVPTGLSNIDKILGGLHRSDLDILAARPATGKTSLMLTLARNQVRSGIPVGIFSIEMARRQLTQRLVAMESGVDSQAIRHGRLSPLDWGAVSDAVGLLNEAPLYIDDSPTITLAQLRSTARRWVREHGIQVLYVDYLQKLSMGLDWRENRTQEVGAIAKGLKQLARELDIPVLALSQLSRAVEGRADKKPILSDLRESGDVEQEADVVMFIHRDDVYNPDSERKNIADIIVAKHRNGPIGQVSLYFQAAQTLYRNLAVTDRVEMD